MSKSMQEEILSALYAICAVLCFGFGFLSAGYIFSIKAFFDLSCSIRYGYMEAQRALKNKKEAQP